MGCIHVLPPAVFFMITVVCWFWEAAVQKNRSQAEGENCTVVRAKIDPPVRFGKVRDCKDLC